MQGTQQRTRSPGPLTPLMLAIFSGPPCSGRGTWIAQRAWQGDMVLDRIALAIEHAL